MNKLYLDFETRSRVDLTKVGAWAYASHPSTEIICMGFAPDEDYETKGIYQLRPLTLGMGRELGYPPKARAMENALIVAHNVQFEYAIYHFILHKRFGWPALMDPKRWDCTMARAYMCGLPGSLEGAALALKLPFQKDSEGRAALLKICKPQVDGTFNEDPALYQRVYDYNGIDVETERALDRALPELPDSERKIFELDLKMNARGIAIDLRSATYAQQIAGALTNDLNADLYRLTEGAVSKATRIAEMKRWIVSQGVKIPIKEDKNGKEKETLDKEAVGDLLQDPAVPPLIKTTISIRQQVGKSSVAKFQSMIVGACEDGRVRGTLQYHGAHTGRWAGRNIQPQNYPQGLVDAEQEQAIELLKEGPAFFKAVYNSKSMQTLTGILRGMLIPSQGKIFLGADYNAIEARVLFWVAGEEGALAQYRRGESPYISMAETIYEKENITKKTHAQEYDIGKRSVLGCGFGLGWVRFQSNVYTETAKYNGVGLQISDELAQRAVRSYREKYRRVVGLWYEIEAAAINAVLNPGQIFACAGGKLQWGISKDRQFLCCKLPSGRLLRYFRPEIKKELTKFGKEKQVLYYWTSAGEGAIKTECNGFLGLYKTWGGELVENIVQATARDIMANGMLKVEAAGYRLLLTIHDELLAEMGSLSDGIREENEISNFLDLMCELPSWADGCPITAEGWVGKRYRK